MRRTSIVVGLMCGAGVAGAEPPRYELTIIEHIPGVDAEHAPVAINDLGWVVGTYSVAEPRFGFRGFLWKPDGGPAVDLGAPPDKDVIGPTDINNDGVVIGGARTGFTGTSRAWTWRDGVFTEYEQLVPGRPNAASCINNAGRVVGYANDGSFTGEQALEYFPDGSFELLPPDGLVGSDRMLAINNNDLMMGEEYRGVFVWRDGDPDRTFLPPPSLTLSFFGPFGMNDLGDVVGRAHTPTHVESTTAAVWFHDTGWRLLPAPGRWRIARAINSDRVVVGTSVERTGTRGDHGWYWTAEDGYHALEDLIEPAGSGWAVGSAYDINERGQIIVWVYRRDTFEPAKGVLTPIDDTCVADCDADGELLIFDFLCFQNAFGAGDTSADCDGDGSLTVFDFLCFQNAFDAGCG